MSIADAGDVYGRVVGCCFVAEVAGCRCGRAVRGDGHGPAPLRRRAGALVLFIGCFIFLVCVAFVLRWWLRYFEFKDVVGCCRSASSWARGSPVEMFAVGAPFASSPGAVEFKDELFAVGSVRVLGF